MKRNNYTKYVQSQLNKLSRLLTSVTIHLSSQSDQDLLLLSKSLHIRDKVNQQLKQLKHGQ